MWLLSLCYHISSTNPQSRTCECPEYGSPIPFYMGKHDVVQEVMRMLSVQCKLHCPYRPQASGQVQCQTRL